jgi:Trp operon repressor
MSMAFHEELFRFLMTKSEDPDVKARQALFRKLYVDMSPEVQAEVQAKVQAEVQAATAKARAAEARSALRRVLARRKLALSADEEMRIDVCADLPTLERWHDQAVEAQSTAEALQ